jgi:hypothetical protein
MEMFTEYDNITPLHRVLRPLNFKHVHGRGRDGEVIHRNKIPYLRAQPYKNKYRGVSFFVPHPDLAPQVHTFLNVASFSCKVTLPAVSLPDNIVFVKTGPHYLRLLDDHGESKEVNCGDHWALCPSKEMTVECFEGAYNIFINEKVTCTMGDGSFELDEDILPGDDISRVAVMALEELSDGTDDPNDKLFSRLFSYHIRAVDMDFDELLKQTHIADMVACALEVFIARDPEIYTHACKAQDLLADVVTYEQKRTTYKPFWVSSL